MLVVDMTRLREQDGLGGAEALPDCLPARADPPTDLPEQPCRFGEHLHRPPVGRYPPGVGGMLPAPRPPGLRASQSPRESHHAHVPCPDRSAAAPAAGPSDESHLHFGDGSTTTELELEPGEHTLCLQAGNGTHEALDLTDEITVTVT